MYWMLEISVVPLTWSAATIIAAPARRSVALTGAAVSGVPPSMIASLPSTEICAPMRISSLMYW